MTPDRDERLALALADRRHRGEPSDVRRYDPDLAGELNELWAVAQFADLARGHNTASHRSEETAAAGPMPPREFGDYELLEEIGRGGMGVVYRAQQKALGRFVALKMVREPHLAGDADRARFRGEAEAAARLKHPNIVTVHAVGAHDGQAYICMEHVPGANLAQSLAAEGAPAPRAAAKLVASIARAVHHAHEQGILHRDLKPSNILLTADGTPKVSDFGLAKRIDGPETLTRTGDILGTPSYMPPEQATGKKDLTPAADVYSLGAILYELLTGRPPFQATRRYDTILMLLEQDPVPPRALNPSVDRDLELICLKCLQKPPGMRYPSAALLAADLDAFAAGEAVSTHPTGVGYFVARLLRETHHAEVLENWGVLWMWHSLMIFLLCLATQLMHGGGLDEHLYYLVLWTVGLAAWGSILWKLRRRAGPVLFVERQIAHAWAAGVLASIAMFTIEVAAGLPALTLSPAIAVAAGMVFVFKAGILSGQFYLCAAASFATACAMPWVRRHYGADVVLFGAVSAVCFFFPGLKYYRQRRRGLEG